MKKSLIAVGLSLAFSGAALAQTAAPARTVSPPVVPAPISSIVPKPELHAPAMVTDKVVNDTQVNPFSGQRVSDEEMRRDLERRKRQTQISEEVLKQTNLSNELQAATMRKNVEIAQANTQLQKEHNAQIELRSVLETREAERLRITQNYEAEVKRQQEERRLAAAKEAEAKKKAAEEAARNKLSPTAAAEKRRAEAAAIKAAAELKEAQARAIVEAKPVNLPKLVSTMAVSGNKVAIINDNGRMTRYEEGDNTPWGVVKVLTSDTISLGGQKLSLRGDTTTRFVRSDVSASDFPQPTVVTQMGGGMVQAAPAAAAPVAAPAPAAEEKPLGQRGVLPALKLPPPIPR